MNAAILEAEKTLPYPARELCKLVGDVKSYPRFIPWLKSLRVLSEKPLGEGWEGVAEAVVGWRWVSERFSTRVRCAPEEGSVKVSLVKGPFRALDNTWTFEETPEGARVHFWIRYEFRNPLLQRLLNHHREEAQARIMAAFVEEAKRRLSGR
ncbi:MAG: type II toxin-antitoxin system RatA family toxin [Hyphomonadaceae bacterium]